MHLQLKEMFLKYDCDDIFTIDNPLRNIFPRYISSRTSVKLNKANTSDKETSFLDLNIKNI